MREHDRYRVLCTCAPITDGSSVRSNIAVSGHFLHRVCIPLNMFSNQRRDHDRAITGCNAKH